MEKKKKFNNNIFFILLFILFIVVLSSMIGSASENSTGNRNSDKKSLKTLFFDLQKQGQVKIQVSLRKLKQDFNWKLVLFILGFSLVYGAFHALGPGHGKILIASYFMKSDTDKKDPFFISLIISVTHTFSSIILALLFQTVLSSYKGFDQIKIHSLLIMVSGLLIITLSLWGIGEKFIKKSGNGVSNTLKDRKGNKYLLGFAIGIVPCPLALTIMLMSVLYGFFWIGFFSVVALTVSMTFVLFIIAFYTAKFKDKIERINNNKNWTYYISTIFSIAGSIILIIFGILLFLTGKNGFFV